VQNAPQPQNNHRQPTNPEPHDARELDTDDLDPIPQPDWPAQRRHTREEPTMTTSTTRIDWTHLHAELSQPFADSEIRYRAGATNRDKTKAQALPYVDPRTYEDRLNQIVPGNWEVTFEPWGEHRIICRLTIHGVTRSSTGEANDSPDGIAGTSAEAQAFKRACAKFGLGRYLYALTPQWVEYDATRKTVVEPVPRRPTPPLADRSVDHLGAQRASAMRRELERLGIPRHRHVGLASQTLKRTVHDLAELTSSEARHVWGTAEAEHHRLAAMKG
jgi:hypothetical protein